MEAAISAIVGSLTDDRHRREVPPVNRAPANNHSLVDIAAQFPMPCTGGEQYQGIARRVDLDLVINEAWVEIQLLGKTLSRPYRERLPK